MLGQYIDTVLIQYSNLRLLMYERPLLIGGRHSPGSLGRIITEGNFIVLHHILPQFSTTELFTCSICMPSRSQIN